MNGTDNIPITQIELTIDGHKLTLTMDQAKQLAGILGNYFSQQNTVTAPLHSYNGSYFYDNGLRWNVQSRGETMSISVTIEPEVRGVK